jgi:hypothetical protein
MMNHLTLLTLLVASLPMIVVAEDDVPVNSLRKLIDESVHWYQLRKSSDHTTVLKPIVVMRWPNSLRGSADGATVIWIGDGRPEVVGAIYPWEGKLFVHEFDSLSRGKIEATSDDELVWSPDEAGLKFRTSADWPEPARSRSARLRQMKSLVREFQATLLGWNSDDSQREELRMMPRALYRYDIDSPKEVSDGALFAFATGTDPETILVLEAVRTPDKPQWQYAFVRRTSGKLQARFRGQVVWEVDRFPKKNDVKSTHIQFSRPLGDVLPDK